MRKKLYPYLTESGHVICSKFDNLTEDAAEKRLTLGKILINRKITKEKLTPIKLLNEIEEEINARLYGLLLRYEDIILEYVKLVKSKENINDCKKYA